MNRLQSLHTSVHGTTKRKPNGKPAERQALSQATSARGYSRPFYGTGEHVLSGEDLPELEHHEQSIKPFLSTTGYPVGKANAAGQRVLLSYGELLTMGDLYDTYDDMQTASHKELLRLKQLVRKSRQHYWHAVTRGSAGGHPNASDAEWQKATKKRYVKLALDNFAHFAPTDPSIASAGGASDDHYSEWRKYHSRALAMVRAEPTDQVTETALTVNGFGDHFLTDSFAAGHLFNKRDVAARFRAKLAGANGKLTSEGDTFFGGVAYQAWKGDLKKTFSKHETTDKYVLTIGSYQFPWAGFHPNINSWKRFKEFLIGIFEAEPDVIGKSLIAKIVHDKLNAYPGGLPVENLLGDRWKLSGDGTLDSKNLGMMRKAVARSIYNVVIEAPTVSNLDGLYQKVWQYTPRPTTTSKKTIASLVDTYTTPNNTTLIRAAADLVGGNYQMLLEEAKSRGKLQRA